MRNLLHRPGSPSNRQQNGLAFTESHLALLREDGRDNPFLQIEIKALSSIGKVEPHSSVMALAALCLARARRTSDPVPHQSTAASLIAAKAGIKSVTPIWDAAFAGVSAVE